MANRGDVVVSEILKRIHDVIREHDVTYEEYAAGKQWLIDVGAAGEWPLFLDVFVEHAVEHNVHRDRPGSDGTILGPYYLPDSPWLQEPYELPHRPDEQGEPLVMAGQVRGVDGEPLAGAELDIWHADADGLYSGFSEIPEGILRGRIRADADGRYAVRTIAPAPYTIPHDGPCGQLIRTCGWHPWRPAHIHLIVKAEGHEPLITQLYMSGGDYIDDDVAQAVKPGLIIEPHRRESDPRQGITTPHLRVDYDFELAEAPTPAVLT
jgi:catechol 1,2-dioxygenase